MFSNIQKYALKKKFYFYNNITFLINYRYVNKTLISKIKLSR